MRIFSSLLQCGVFIIIPVITFGIGIWKIIKLNPKYQKVSISALIGFIFFEASIIGLIIDPRSSGHSFQELLVLSGIIGFATSLFVLILLPIGTLMLNIFKNK